MTEDRPAAESPRRIDRFVVISELGRGSMGRVYLAHDPNTDRRLALKVRTRRQDADPEEEESSRARFLLEGRAAGRLQHEGIVLVYDADTDPETGQAYLAMEWVEGQSLAALLKKKGQLPWATAARMAAEVAAALDHAHERGVVHRDVKPANILIGIEGRVKVSDFGIAKVLSADAHTLAGQVLGTPHYMSPEQLRSEPLDGRSDLFSLGAVLYEMLAGQPPFPGDTLASVTYKIAWVDPRPPSFDRDDLPAALERIVMRLLAKSPEDRFARGREVADALAAVIADPGETSQTTTLPRAAPAARSSRRAPRSSAPPRRSMLRRVLAAAAIVAAVGVAAYLLDSGRSVSPSTPGPEPVLEVAEAAPAPEPVAVDEAPPEPAVADAQEPVAASPATPAPKPRPRRAPASPAPGAPSPLARALAALPAPFSTTQVPSRPAPSTTTPAVEPATLEILHANRLRGGWMTIWIDRKRAWSHELRAPANILDRVAGEELRIPLRLSPGEHEIEVRIAHVKAHIDSGGITHARFGAGEKRWLRVTLHPYLSKLALHWDP